MHAASLLKVSAFDASRNGQAADVEELFPAWSRTDRLGIVVHEPFGGLGASLMIQAAIALFYKHDRSRAHRKAQYPPIFMFHVGGRFGDHSAMDFWPARREIFLGAEPADVLGGIMDRAITRLIVPDVAPGTLEYVTAHPSGWTDLHAAREQITSCYAYSATGTATAGDVELTGNDAGMETMVEDVLQPDRLAGEFRQRNDTELLELPLGPSTTDDVRGWLRHFLQRTDEIPATIRTSILDHRRTAFPDRTVTQKYRSVTVHEALQRLTPN